LAPSFCSSHRPRMYAVPSITRYSSAGEVGRAGGVFLRIAYD
jgi:hypothetical protein